MRIHIYISIHKSSNNPYKSSNPYKVQTQVQFSNSIHKSNSQIPYTSPLLTHKSIYKSILNSHVTWLVGVVATTFGGEEVVYKITVVSRLLTIEQMTDLAKNFRYVTTQTQ